VSDDVRALIEALRGGRLDPMAAEVEGLRRELYWTALAITGHPEDASDAVAETLFKVWRHIRSLREPERFDGWCRRILVNECRRIWRSRRHQVPVDPTNLPQLPGDDHGLAEVEGMGVLRSMLAQLNEGERAVVTLRYMHDMPLEDIGEFLEIPLGTVKSRLARAHARLRIGAAARGGVSHGA